MVRIIADFDSWTIAATFDGETIGLAVKIDVADIAQGLSESENATQLKPKRRKRRKANRKTSEGASDRIIDCS